MLESSPVWLPSFAVLVRCVASNDDSVIRSMVLKLRQARLHIGLAHGPRAPGQLVAHLQLMKGRARYLTPTEMPTSKVDGWNCLEW